MANITGTVGDDILNGGTADDQLDGLGGNDLLNGRGGNDVLIGGTGDDTYVVDSPGDSIVELENEGSDTVYTDINFWLAADDYVELLSARDWRSTTPLQLFGNGLDNTIDGNDGDNFIDGVGGRDTMVGFAGNDTYVVDNSSDRVVEAAGGGFDTIYTEVSYSLTDGDNVELLSARDWLSLTPLILTGNSAANTIDGNDGANLLDGQGGADVLVGMGGNDVYVVDNAGDQVVEGSGGGEDLIYTSVDYALAPDMFIETLSARDVTSTAALALTGNTRENSLYGGAGNDVLDGGGSRDLMYGGQGDDTYYVDYLAAEGSTFRDTLFELAGEGTDTVYIAPAGNAIYFTLDPFVENGYVLDPAYNFFVRLTGNVSDNRLSGGAAADTLMGVAGDDYLDGKGGNDGLFGGAGADTFAFTTAPGQGNTDTIADFAAGVDKIALDNAVFAGLPEGALSAGAFVNGAAAQDADDRILYSGTVLSFDADGTGAIAPVAFASLMGGPAITATDFIVI